MNDSKMDDQSNSVSYFKDKDNGGGENGNDLE